MNRRDALRRLGALASTIALDGCARARPSRAAAIRASNAPNAPAAPAATVESASREAEVLVVGAGIAGLRAAQALREAGVAVIVLEARERTGGRIHTDHSWSGLALDMGASWIHGVRDNPVAALVASLGIATAPSDYAKVLYDPAGRALDVAHADAIDARVRRLVRAAHAAVDDDEADITLRAAIERVYAAAPPAADVALENEYGLSAELELDYAADVGELSARSFDDGGDEPGGDVVFPGGYGQVVAAVARGTDVRTGHVVTRVAADDRGVRVFTSQGEFRGRFAVVTLPLGVLRAGSVEFAPALSRRKRRALARLGMGTLSKMYARFARVFWPTAPEFINRVPDAAHRARWCENMSVAHFAAGAPVLLGFNAGAFGRAVEAMPPADAAASFAEALRGIYGPATPSPLEVMSSAWSRDPFALGAYSYLPPGATLADRDALAATEGDRVFFAGEATSHDHAATVHGAYASGQRAAREVLAARE